MPVVPNPINEAISFFENHWPVWTANAANIGLTTTQTTNVKNAAIAARTAFNDAATARAASKAATEALSSKMEGLRYGIGAECIRSIRTYAENTNNPTVYQLAQIPAPAAPTPLPPPGQPESFKVLLNPDGSIRILWKSTNSTSSQGSWFAVTRKLFGENSYVGVGGNSKREFTDLTLPAGADGASYIVTPFRNGVVGTASQVLTVQFGVGGGGGFAIASVTGGTLRQAA